MSAADKMASKFKPKPRLLLMTSSLSCCLLLLLALANLSSKSTMASSTTSKPQDLTRFKSSMRDLILQNPKLNSKSALAVAGNIPLELLGSLPAAAAASELEYKCAKHCSCSVIQVHSKASSRRANLTQTKCESSQFSDLLTIDRRTQLIHISLPREQSANGDISGPSSLIKGKQGQRADSGVISSRPASKQFRMPRLVQFSLLREVIIVNLKFQVCDSEVFKRGQKLRRLQLNHNQLVRISKACLKHLDKLVELNLDYNNLDELESALFSGLLSLRSLSIAHNQLSDLAAHQFANLTNLISLNLVGNSFKTINLHLFEPMQISLRLLLLAKNQIKSFVYAPIQTTIQQQTTTAPMAPLQATTNQANTFLANLTAFRPNNNNSASLPLQIPTMAPTKVAALFAGVVFKNLVKLNVDQNKLERIKQLQLHRFFNIKFLSIRQNNIATIRDKAFNGLKLIELNLAQNQLQTISKCAFCNANIKRLVLAQNNISVSLQQQFGGDSLSSASQFARPLVPVASAIVSASSDINETTASAGLLPEPAAQQQQEQDSRPASGTQLSATSSQNMLILSQSIFGPLFGQLEYLDLSKNEQLTDQLEFLLEPLLRLEYLNLASVGLDRSLPSPTLFKNLRQLRYLNLSHNQLDQLVSETVEPLTALEILDLSHNKFSELDESFLVTVDELAALRVLNLGSNPWFCSQCKVAPIYDWLLRSPIYNVTCLAASALQHSNNNNNGDKEQAVGSDSVPSESTTSEESTGDASATDQNQSELDSGGRAQDNNDPQAGESLPAMVDAKSGLASRPYLANNGEHRVRRILADAQQPDYSLLIGDDDKTEATIDFDISSLQDEDLSSATSGYNLIPGNNPSISSPRDLATIEDDPSIAETLVSVLSTTNFVSVELCMKCEFPGELSGVNLHELSASDFKICPGSAPRFAASEPKIGLTLALVIIGVLFCIIIVVIVMYRKKNNTYYPNEDTDHLDGAGGLSGKKPVFSISSDGDHQYDATDYSSPPMSQSYESYSQADEEDDEEYEDEDEEFDDEDEELDDVREEDEDEEKTSKIGEEDNEANNEDREGVAKLKNVAAKRGKDNYDDGTTNTDNSGPSGKVSGSTGGSNSRQSSLRKSIKKETEEERRQQVDSYNQRNESAGTGSGSLRATKQSSQSIRSILASPAVSDRSAVAQSAASANEATAASAKKQQCQTSTQSATDSRIELASEGRENSGKFKRLPSNSSNSNFSLGGGGGSSSHQTQPKALEAAALAATAAAASLVSAGSRQSQQQQLTQTPSQELHSVQMGGRSKQSGLDSAGSQPQQRTTKRSTREEAAKQEHVARLLHFESSAESKRRQLRQSSLEYPGKKRAVKSSQTIDQVAASGRMRAYSPVSARSTQTSGGSGSRLDATEQLPRQQQQHFKVLQTPQPEGETPLAGSSHIGNNGSDYGGELNTSSSRHMSRQRFAFSKETSREPVFSDSTGGGGSMLGRTAALTSTKQQQQQQQQQQQFLVREPTLHDEYPDDLESATELSLGCQEESEGNRAGGELRRQIAHLERILSPTLSDATTADSLANLEQMYEPTSLELVATPTQDCLSGSGGALEAAEDEKEEANFGLHGQQEFTHSRRYNQRHLMPTRVRMSHSSSNHSALTQTSAASNEMD